MFNDCWPTSVSWSVVDYYGNPKPAYYVFRRCAKPVITSLYEEDGEIKAYVCVNGKNGVSAKGRVYLYNVLTGEKIRLQEFDGKFSVGQHLRSTAEKSKITADRTKLKI